MLVNSYNHNTFHLRFWEHNVTSQSNVLRTEHDDTQTSDWNGWFLLRINVKMNLIFFLLSVFSSNGKLVPSNYCRKLESTKQFHSRNIITSTDTVKVDFFFFSLLLNFFWGGGIEPDILLVATVLAVNYKNNY